MKNFFMEGGGMGLGGRVCTRWVSLHVISERMEIYSFLHIVENSYPQDDF
jgi:hypothetical protein